jgi:ferredoxin
MKTYPRLMDQMRDIMEEWKEEREQLLINAEQTHAYCQSLAFQVHAWRPTQRLRVCRHCGQCVRAGGGRDVTGLIVRVRR